MTCIAHAFSLGDEDAAGAFNAARTTPGLLCLAVPLPRVTLSMHDHDTSIIAETERPQETCIEHQVEVAYLPWSVQSAFFACAATRPCSALWAMWARNTLSVPISRSQRHVAAPLRSMPQRCWRPTDAASGARGDTARVVTQEQTTAL